MSEHVNLQNACNNKTSLKISLQKDMKNNRLVLWLRALGLMGKLVTGLWMHQLYTSQATWKHCVYQDLSTEFEYIKRIAFTSFASKNRYIFGVSLYPDYDAILKELQTADIAELERKNCILYWFYILHYWSLLWTSLVCRCA